MRVLVQRLSAQRFGGSVRWSGAAVAWCAVVACGGGLGRSHVSLDDDVEPDAGGDASAESNTDSSAAGAQDATGPDARALDARNEDATSATPDGGDGASTTEAGPLPPDPCIEAGTCPAGSWIDVNPPGFNLTNPPSNDCGTNYGTKTVQVDPASPSNLYTTYMCQGVWKSVDYGLTWTGPVNGGANSATTIDCDGQISIPRSGTTSPPRIYESCIAGLATGFWRSDDGGETWTSYNVAPAGSFQQFYAPTIDPYDADHLLMVTHTKDQISESKDGGQTWTSVTMDPRMMAGNGGTGGLYFVNTGDPSTTATTWMWAAAATGGTIGMWRTDNSGAAWTHVDNNEHTTGATEFFYQPDTSGVVFVAGVYSALGWGVLRSADYGVTWAAVGQNAEESTVVGTKKNLYAMFGWAPGPGQTVNPMLEVSAVPGTGSWTSPGTPATMTQGVGQIAVTNDGTHSILVAANYNAGLWRYVEP
jgi:hypothetical protein